MAFSRCRPRQFVWCRLYLSGQPRPRLSRNWVLPSWYRKEGKTSSGRRNETLLYYIHRIRCIQLTKKNRERGSLKKDRDITNDLNFGCMPGLSFKDHWSDIECRSNPSHVDFAIETWMESGYIQLLVKVRSEREAKAEIIREGNRNAKRIGNLRNQRYNDSNDSLW